MTSANEIYALLVPIQRQRLLLPRTAVREVVRYSKPEPIENAPDWLPGTINWQNNKIPMISFEGLCGKEMPEVNSRTRVAIMTALDKEMPHNAYAMYVEGFPQLIGIQEKDLGVDAEAKFPDNCPIISQLKLFNDRPQIPNLEYIEKKILQQL
ncbi:MAG: chemotaxis protein CheW [Gammaproteobacteria bacterium]|nr:chemotaxis protein CheW [Gammaproteobacteria bacterium]NNC97153.1 chemotaxis protein CheW [Gammaproteobacteria bacterium]NNM13717.1 chemotaxis protein CheW [Gammaproteobacteria bacterium]